MTLKDFIKVFDFNGTNRILVYSTGLGGSYIGSYASLSEFYRDLNINVYRVIDICPVDSTTIQITISY